MRSRLIRLAPAASLASSIRPSTCAGTPESSRCGAGPRRAGQFLRTSSWLPPMPPEVTTTACAVISNGSTSTRELASPRATSLGSSTCPRTPVTAPSVTTRSSTRCRNRSWTRPFSAASFTRRENGATMPGPVPQAMWNRGPELPCPVAVYPPRSAQPTIGKNPMPCYLSQARFSPAANCRYASAHCRARWSSSRSNPAVPSQSCRASSSESCTRSRRCSGESTRNSPPKDHHACPPREASGSWSTRTTRLPASASSAVATSPASPAPTTTTSVSVVTAGTLAGAAALPPSPRGATPPAQRSPPCPGPHRPAQGERQAADRADEQQQRLPQRRAAAERAEEEHEGEQGEQQDDARRGGHEPRPATAEDHEHRAGERDRGQQRRDDHVPVQQRPRLVEQPAQVEELGGDQDAEDRGERRLQGARHRRGRDGAGQRRGPRRASRCPPGAGGGRHGATA